MGRRDLPGEYTLLCERCGYDIESLPKDAACPECGKAIRESLPEARVGTPWQRSPSPVSMLRTWKVMLTGPGVAFDRARVDPLGSVTLLLATVRVASAVPVAGVAVQLGVRELQTLHPIAVLVGVAAIGLFLFAVGWILLASLTWIEERGIRFWGPRRGWRITPAIAKVICAHASVGWLLGSVLAVPAHLLGLAMLDWTNHNNAGIFRGPMQLAPITLPALCLIAGMLTFEVLVYIGMNRMKFANRARPTPDAPLDASMPPASVPSDSVTSSETHATP